MTKTNDDTRRTDAAKCSKCKMDDREAEKEIIKAAYDPTEARVEDDTIVRELEGLLTLKLKLTENYPEEPPLVSISVRANEKGLHDGAPKLIEECQELASDMVGQSSVLSIIQLAETWVGDYKEAKVSAEAPPNESAMSTEQPQSQIQRLLIYSHHIISKIKRGNIMQLTQEYGLTGIMKVGWPGLILVEGNAPDPYNFYQEIKQWNWKYLVVRGEMEGEIRVFQEFHETDSLSDVADACRNGGVDDLYQTFMKGHKVQDNNDDEMPYGILVRVDHMNNGKSYRKWLRKTADDKDCNLMIKEYDGYRVVVISESQSNVQRFMKAWRTSKVDVDSKGKPCLERQMTTLIEGQVNQDAFTCIDWNLTHRDDQSADTSDLSPTLAKIGGHEWVSALG